MAKKKCRTPAASDWQVDFVRLIAFPLTPPILLDQEWWRGAVGEQPDDYAPTRKKKKNIEPTAVRSKVSFYP